MRLKDKVAIITGASSDIGFATAELMLQEGATVVFTDIHEDATSPIQALTSVTKSRYIKADVANEGEIANLFAETIKVYGHIDVVFANASIRGNKEPCEELLLEDWQQMVDVNLTGIFLTNKYALKYMLPQGSGAIINNATALGCVGQIGHTVYPATKGGIINLTRSLGITYAAKGIRINAVCPGYISSHTLDYMTPELKADLVKLHPIGRLGKAEEIAKAVLFLASEDASFIVGTSLLVDGGYTAQ
ncbi:SDR family NAD(P)-dependent oxidoreductase [Entomomonas asaccharolytica]|uniref:SDR family oxidoreductase n=1 Tax=Entomomonas asaccharolytica TaxID=2785331 RepID=A0A974RWF1_9GAMM|nr:SDR family oxidoreductase [Entomomonas asaccharolytica]QQP85143.1 SDR family oxidoreductase [Entomomonas asaccharolytica]